MEFAVKVWFVREQQVARRGTVLSTQLVLVVNHFTRRTNQTPDTLYIVDFPHSLIGQKDYLVLYHVPVVFDTNTLWVCLLHAVYFGMACSYLLLLLIFFMYLASLLASQVLAATVSKLSIELPITAIVLYIPTRPIQYSQQAVMMGPKSSMQQLGMNDAIGGREGKQASKG